MIGEVGDHQCGALAHERPAYQITDDAPGHKDCAPGALVLWVDDAVGCGREIAGIPRNYREKTGSTTFACSRRSTNLDHFGGITEMVE